MSSDLGFSGIVAFVTGAASGVGRAAALAFARAGASAVAADVSDEGNQETGRMVEQQRPRDGHGWRSNHSMKPLFIDIRSTK